MSTENNSQGKPSNPIGAVLVMGGGVGGMQATLDLVNSGYKVYLVDSSPSIGGKMAQLDKTFPTNDCSMCIVSPKLVEVGRHKDIELLTWSEVDAIEGEAGNFTVKVRRKPRYVDLEKCTGCGDCEISCPVTYKAYFPEKPAEGEKVKKPKAKNKVTKPYRAAVTGKAPQAWKFEVDAEACKACGICSKSCPVGAIKWEKKEIAVIDQDKCIACGACFIACPPKTAAIKISEAPEVAESGLTAAIARRSVKLSDQLAGQDSDCLRCGLCALSCNSIMGANAIRLTAEGIEVGKDICRGCGACVNACPVGFLKIEDVCERPARPLLSKMNEKLDLKHAIDIYYPQAVPRVPVIDDSACAYINTDGEACGVCKSVCGVDAIDFTQKEVIEEVKVGSVILSPGFEEFPAELRGEFGYGTYPNVVTSIQFERYLSASGPTMGHVVRPSDHKEPKKIAWIQCVGSRDCSMGRDYCSSVCCMYATKEATIAKEHDPACEPAIFYIDLRAAGKGFEEYAERAKNEHGIRYVRSMVSRVYEDPQTGNLELRYYDEAGQQQREEFDMVVLSVGLQIKDEIRQLTQKFGIEADQFGFTETASFDPLQTNRPGVVVCGVLNGTKDIPETVNEASGAAMAAAKLLAPSRGSLIKEETVTPETKLRGDEGTRVGVFVCHCGKNIGGVIDVPGIAQYAAGLQDVVYATDTLYACSMDAQEIIVKAIKEQKLNRVVVAACSPRTHEPLFQETLTNAGLNKYLFEFVNIRNHCSWVHKDEPVWGTEKAKDLVRMAVAKVCRAEALKEAQLEIDPSAMVIGGGIAGMTAARSLSAQGYRVELIERDANLGGQALNLYRTWMGEDVQAEVARLIGEVEGDENITVHLATELDKVDGFVGNFKSTLVKGGEEKQIKHGVAIVATGAKPYQPAEYLFGEDARVITHQQLDRRFIEKDESLAKLSAVAFIQCVGSRDAERPYCSRVCCTHTVENAVTLKELNPDQEIYVFYRDIRTYGNRELLYKKARDLGVNFIRYDVDRKPEAKATSDGLEITCYDPSIRRPVTVKVDLLALATGVVSHRDEKLAQLFKVSMTEAGWFLEAHVKLGPSEFATDGVFLCGMAHYPKAIDEAITQGQAAASRALTLLAREKISVSGTVAVINPRDCSSCGVCIEVCPFSAPSFITGGPFTGKSEVNPMLCKGCGLCVASCRSGAIRARGFDEKQIMAQIAEAI